MTSKQEAVCCRANGTGNCCLDGEEARDQPDHVSVCLSVPHLVSSCFSFTPHRLLRPFAPGSLQKTPRLFDEEEFVPLDPTQELIFPPELIVSPMFWPVEASPLLRGRFIDVYSFPPQLMAEASKPQTLTFSGERMSWVSPASLDELVQLKTRNPKAPLVMGNTHIGKTGSRDAAAASKSDVTVSSFTLSSATSNTDSKYL